ncbi:MAG: hypothetical protein E7398_00305 [Ruminococcaceae bacterium]|nr:hypothetical protein [Oscillospiraceae bacterium]
MYGKLENGRFIKAKHFIIDGNATIINPTDEMYKKNGFKKLIESEMPELNENQSFEISYEETETGIIKNYKVVEITEVQEG